MKKTIMMTAISLATLVCAIPMKAETSLRFLELVSKIESSGNPQAVGDNGLARGEFQFHRAAWEQVSSQMRKQGKKAYPYAYAHDRFVATQYATAYLDWIGGLLSVKLGRKPHAWEIYASFNRGVGGFEAIGFNFARLPKHTQRSCKLIATTFNEPL